MSSVPREQAVATALADQIAFRLQAAILDGEYPPGTRLSQDELSERFGVSRTPVREALRKLQAQRLVDLIPNKGATVRTQTRLELTEVYAMRAELEGMAAELAADHISDEELGALESALAASVQAVVALEAGSVDPADATLFNARITAANERFHGVIHNAARNSLLQRYVNDLQHFFPKDYVWRAVSVAEEVRTMNVDEHAAIQRALVARDGQAARKAMHSHITHAGTLLIAHLDQHLTWV